MRGVTQRLLACVLVPCALSCAGSRLETVVEISVLNLDEEATEIDLAVHNTLNDRATERMFLQRRLVESGRGLLILEQVLAETTIEVELSVRAGATVIQEGRVSGVPRVDRPARWSVTLVPVGQPANVCDGLDNNENGEVDENDCTG